MGSRSGRGARGARHGSNPAGPGRRQRGRGPTHGAGVTGTIRIGVRGTATVEGPHLTYHVSARDVGPAMNGDQVLVRALSGADRRRDGRVPAAVVRVLSRATARFVATYVRDGALRVLVPLDDRLAHDFLAVDPAPGEPAAPAASSGDVVCARIVDYPAPSAAGTAVIERRIGPAGDPAAAIESIIVAHDLPGDFPRQALLQAQGASFDVREVLESEPLRRDLRDELVVTIDPRDARDYDDALSVSPRREGGWVLGVHIADVGRFVPMGTPLDLEARRRAMSVYLADRVIPMLPPRLSDDLCSLAPGADRLAMTCRLALDEDGRVVGADLFPSVVRSLARLSYDQVDAVLEAGSLGASPGAGPDAGQVVGGAVLADPARLAHMLVELDRIRALRGRVRAARGSLDFESVEARAVLDEDGRAVGVSVRRRTRATGLVEEAMLMANEAVARYLDLLGAPAPFRVHEEPAPESLARALPRVDALLPLDAQERAGLLAGEPAAIRQVLARAQEAGAGLLVSSVVLRSMRRASYVPQDLGHFGLGARSYCHFTSPIRRYPDLMVHRALKAGLAGRLRGGVLAGLKEAVPAVCEHASAQERVAAQAESESTDVKVAEYLAGQVGRRYPGTVSGVTPFGLFVLLDDLGVEGLLHLARLPGRVDYDERTESVARASDGARWRLGTRLEVEVSSADPMRGLVELSLASPAQGPGAKGRPAAVIR